MAQYLSLYPAPNLSGSNNGSVSNYGFVFAQTTPEDYGQGRIDYNISSNDSVFGRYTIDQSSLPFVGQFNGNFSTETARNQFVTLAENHVFSGSKVNSVRFSFTREPLDLTETYTNPSETTAAFQLVSTPGIGMGSLTPTGASGIGASTLSPRHQFENIYTGSDDFAYEKGKHSLKFGALFNHYQYQIVTHGYDRGVIGFSSVAGLMQGGAGPGTTTVGGVVEPTPTLTTLSLTVPSNDEVTKYLHFDTMGFYAQDSWRLAPRLTVNFGLRYEPTTTVIEAHGNASTLRNFPVSSTFTTGSSVFKNPGLRNLSPRFGFAYDVFGTGRTAIRGGFDLLYDLATWGQTYMNFAGYDPPFSDNISDTNYVQQYTNYKGMSVPLVIPNVNNFQVSYRGPTWNENQPHAFAYNLSLAQQFPGQIAVSLAYAGSHGVDLIQVLEGNNVLPSGVPSTTNGITTCALATSSVINNSNQYDSPAATSCYFYNTSSVSQCWPAMGLTTNCWNRLNSNLPSMIFNPATGESFYNALQATVNKRISYGVQFQGGYTYSKLNDNQQGGSGQDGADMAEEPLHTHSMYGPALFDVRQSFHFNALYHLPKFDITNRLVGGTLNGWWMAGILTAQTGYPFGLELSGDRENISYEPSFATRDSPDIVPGRNNGNITHGVSSGCGSIAAGTKLHTLALWYDPCAFTIQPQGFIGTEPRNDLRGPGTQDLDFSLVKDTAVSKLGEAGSIEFRAEFFDLLNHPNFTIPSQTVSSGTCPATNAGGTTAACPMTPTGTAGTISSTVSGTGGIPEGGQRQIQFGLKIMF